MDHPEPIQAGQAPPDFEFRSRAHGAMLGLLITVLEAVAAFLTLLLGFTLGLLIPAAPDDPNPGFSYLDYVGYAVIAAPATAAIIAVLLAGQMRLGSRFLYTLPIVGPLLIAILLHETTDAWFFPLVLLLPLGNSLLGAVFPLRQS